MPVLKQLRFRVDSYFFLIAVDIHASTFMTTNVNHLIGPLSNTEKSVVKGYGVVIKFIGEVTVKWKIEYNDGKLHSIIIHIVNYVPEAPICLISPHKWFQQASNNHAIPYGAWCTTNANHCNLYWYQ